MHFFKYPRLGAYLGILIEINKCLLEKELMPAVEIRVIFRENLANKQKEVEERMKEIMETKREMEENGEETTELEEEANKINEELKEMKEEGFKSEKV